MKPTIVCVGEIVIDQVGTTQRFAPEDFSTQINQLNLFYGGRAANVAVAAAIFIPQPILIGIVGNDFESSGYLQHLKRIFSKRVLGVLSGLS